MRRAETDQQALARGGRRRGDWGLRCGRRDDWSRPIRKPPFATSNSWDEFATVSAEVMISAPATREGEDKGSGPSPNEAAFWGTMMNRYVHYISSSPSPCRCCSVKLSPSTFSSQGEGRPISVQAIDTCQWICKTYKAMVNSLRLRSFLCLASRRAAERLEGKHFALLAPPCGILMECYFSAFVGIIKRAMAVAARNSTILVAFKVIS